MQPILWYAKSNKSLPMFSDNFGFEDLNNIIRIIYNYFDLSTEMMKSKSRERTLVVPRQFVHYFARKTTVHSLSKIGFMAGNKNHSTVSNSVKIINNLITYNKQIKRDYKNLNALLCQ